MTKSKKSFLSIFSKIKENEFLLISLIIVLGFILFIFPSDLKPIQQPIERGEEFTEQHARKVVSLAQGKQTYFIFTDKPKNPQIIKISLDPLDVKTGETQTIIVQIKDTNNQPITNENKVQATIVTDNKSTIVPFLLRRADGPDLVTIWEGIWECEDNHDYIFQASILAANAIGESFVDLSFR